MKPVLASGFLFVGGAIMLTVSRFSFVPIIGGACAAIGAGWLLYELFIEEADKK